MRRDAREAKQMLRRMCMQKQWRQKDVYKCAQITAGDVLRDIEGDAWEKGEDVFRDAREAWGCF